MVEGLIMKKEKIIHTILKILGFILRLLITFVISIVTSIIAFICYNKTGYIILFAFIMAVGFIFGNIVITRIIRIFKREVVFVLWSLRK